MKMWQSIDLHFAADHPTAAGHFPSNPIVPGALILDEVIAAIAGPDSEGAITVRAAKFLQPVCPGETVNLRWHQLDGGAVKFECHVSGQSNLAMTGALEIGPVPS